MKTLIPETTLARTLAVAPQTLRRRLSSGVLRPDAMIHRGGVLPPTPAFDLARLAEIKALIRPTENETIA